VTHEEVDVAQVHDQAVYQASDVLLLRAAARSLDSAFVPWPDPADAEGLRMWLVKAWEDPVLREAMVCASPSLALRADRIAAGRGVPARQVRSAGVALARYQLRAAGRPTPFGLFAGVAGARFGDSALARFGESHRAAARCDAAWLLSVIERCEACEPLSGRLTLVFSSLALLHAGKWEVPVGPDRQVIRDSQAVRAVWDASQAPVQISALADLLSSAFPRSGDKGTRMLDELLRLGFLITSLRPAMTTTDHRRVRAGTGENAAPSVSRVYERTQKGISQVHETPVTNSLFVPLVTNFGPTAEKSLKNPVSVDAGG
jgi:lantibiotic biosynthesis protein